ncbi:MAG: hypothetical protein AAFY20_27010, partial [Cyanobacteria bacterium J06639_14]
MYSLQSIQAQRQSRKKMARIILLATGGVLSAIGIWVLLFSAGVVTLGGVPYRVLLKVWQDDTARSALLSGAGTAL